MKIITTPGFVARFALPVFVLLLLAGCTKEYSVETGNPAAASGKWSFQENAANFAGSFDSAYISKGTSINELHLVGSSNGDNQKFHLILYADTFTVGTYKASTFNSAFEYGNQAPYTYSAGQLTGEFTVTITSFNKNIIAGIFSGSALKNGADTVAIQNGTFSASLPELIQSPSDGVLGDDSGNCKPIVINGAYRQGTAMNPSNTVSVEVTVTTPGGYTIFTNAVNGVTFSSSGTFTKRGPQTVVLTGSGTPAFNGEQYFIVQYGSSLCGFKITFDNAAAASNDYWPLTAGNYWKYKDMSHTFFDKLLPGTGVVNGQTYQFLGEFQNLTDANYDTTFSIRKSAGSYFTLMNYAPYVGGTDPYYLETIFLKDNVTKGTSWNGPTFSQVVSGTTVNFFLKFTVLDNGVSEALNGFSFPDVIKVKAEMFSGTTPTGISTEAWYAKNVGLIYSKDITGNETIIQDFRVF